MIAYLVSTPRQVTTLARTRSGATSSRMHARSSPSSRPRSSSRFAQLSTRRFGSEFVTAKLAGVLTVTVCEVRSWRRVDVVPQGLRRFRRRKARTIARRTESSNTSSRSGVYEKESSWNGSWNGGDGRCGVFFALRGGSGSRAGGFDAASDTRRRFVASSLTLSSASLEAFRLSDMLARSKKWNALRVRSLTLVVLRITCVRSSIYHSLNITISTCLENLRVTSQLRFATYSISIRRSENRSKLLELAFATSNCVLCVLPPRSSVAKYCQLL